MSAPKLSRNEKALAVLGGIAFAAIFLLPLLAAGGWGR